MDKGFESTFGDEQGDEAAPVETPKKGRGKGKKAQVEAAESEGDEQGDEAAPVETLKVFEIQLRHAPFVKRLKRGKVRAKDAEHAFEKFRQAMLKLPGVKQDQKDAFSQWTAQHGSDHPDVEIKEAS